MDSLTERKANDIKNRRGYEVTGFVLSKGGQAVIVDKAAVRWLDEKELWNLMHPEGGILEHPCMTSAKDEKKP